jgi:salicylate hydroxylase
MPSPRIAIIGGGIGGLATAAFLHKSGLPSVVYEQTRELREIGAGIIVAPNAARLLRRLGVLDPLIKTAVRLETGWEFRRWQDGTVLSAEDLSTRCERLYGEHTYTAHRADVLDVLSSAVPAGTVRLGKRATAISVSGPTATLAFADGESAEADVVIGADGIHSMIRATLTEPVPPAYSGLSAFRALVPAREAPAFARRPAQVLWLGPDHHLVHYPVRAGEFINLVAMSPAGDYTTESWTATATVDELLAEFAGWDPRLTGLIRAAATPGRWALLDRQPLRRWSYGPVTLLGDAAHPMLPFFAQGAAQAIEDAAVLARCLAEDTTDPAAALRRYQAGRIPRTTRIQEVSHARAHLNHLPDGPDQRARDKEFATVDPLQANSWIYAYDPADATPRPATAPTPHPAATPPPDLS